MSANTRNPHASVIVDHQRKADLNQANQEIRRGGREKKGGPKFEAAFRSCNIKSEKKLSSSTQRRFSRNE